MKYIFIKYAVMSFGISSFAQIDLQAKNLSVSDSIISSNVKCNIENKAIRKLLYSLVNNCNDWKGKSSNDESAYYCMISKAQKKGYKIIVNQISMPTYEQIRKSFGIVIINNALILCSGDIPSKIIKVQKDKCIQVKLSDQNANKNVYFDPNQMFKRYEIKSMGEKYRIFIQECKQGRRIRR